MYKKDKGLISAATEIRPFCVGINGVQSYRFSRIGRAITRARGSAA